MYRIIFYTLFAAAERRIADYVGVTGIHIPFSNII
jgi:hypothetical protein